MTLQIAIFDDEDRLKKEWSDRLLELGQGDVVSIDAFPKEVDGLEDRRREARSKKGVASVEDLGIESIFDSIDILIVDYDLLHSIKITGEEIAYLARCYSRCGVIVSLNRYGVTRSFDLTLTGHPGSFADLNVGSDFFDDPGLWSDKEAWKEFRPWSWPILPKLQDSFEKRIADLKKRMDEPILTFLALDAERAGVFPRVTQEFIQGRGREPEETTFEDFLTRSAHGLKPRDVEGSIEELKPRIAAARINHWLECLVLGGQEVLVDAPHLATRFPSLLESQIEQQETWDRTARIDTIDGLNRDILRAFEFPKPHWLSRPAWYWPHIRSHEEIAEVADPWSIAKHDWVFCEDTSRFTFRRDARTFVSDLPTSFSRRFVKHIENIDYHPRVRFSL